MDTHATIVRCSIRMCVAGRAPSYKVSRALRHVKDVRNQSANYSIKKLRKFFLSLFDLFQEAFFYSRDQFLVNIGGFYELSQTQVLNLALCPASSTPFISALSLQPMQCTPNVDGSCPGNFFCWFSTTTSSVNAFYCCRSPDSVDTGCEIFKICLLLYEIFQIAPRNLFRFPAKGALPTAIVRLRPP